MSNNPRPALHQLDTYLEQYLDIDNGFFVEAGAYDGLFASNSYYFETSRDWTGVLIEPVKESYQKCITNRPNSTVLNAALVGPNYKANTIEIDPAGLMSTVIDPSNNIIDRSSYSSHGRSIQGLNEQPVETVPALTLNAILSKYAQNKTIDLLSIDVEGYEEEVIQGLNFNQFAPRILCLELWHYNEAQLTKMISPWMTKMQVITPPTTNKHMDVIYKRNDIL